MLRQEVLEKWNKLKQTIIQNNSGPLVSKQKVRMRLAQTSGLITNFFENIRDNANLSGRFKGEFAKSLQLIQDFITQQIEEFNG